MPGNEKIERILKTVGIPVAYRQFIPFRDKHVPEPPYLIYIISPEEAFGADRKMLAVRRHVIIELYTGKKDTDLERWVETLLKGWEWSKEEDYIESEALYLVRYEFDIYEKIGR